MAAAGYWGIELIEQIFELGIIKDALGSTAGKGGRRRSCGGGAGRRLLGVPQVQRPPRRVDLDCALRDP